MLGFVIGTLCLIGLIKVLRRGYGWGHHGPFAYGGYGHCGHGAGYGPGGGPGVRGRARRWVLRSLFERLETTPGQEKVIVSAIDELRDNRKVVQEELRQTREDLSRAVAGGVIEDSTLEETFARHDRLLAQLRVSFVEAVKKITEALDERQRKQVADLLERGLRGGSHWGGPYRGGLWA